MTKRFQSHLTNAIMLLGLACAGLMTVQAQAQTLAAAPVPAGKASVSGKIPATPAATTHLSWLSLTPAQQQALQPLSASWSQLSEVQKKKWIALSANFNTLTPPAKERLHARMAQWAALTPKQRTLARLNYNQTQRVSPEDKAERWEVYQTFTPEQKRALAASAPKMPLAPHVKVPKTPAH